MNKTSILFAPLILSFLILISPASAETVYQYQTESPIYIVGDVHGAYEEFHTTLKTLGLLDEKDQWSGGTANLVSLGDLIDRGPSSRKILDLLIRLQGETKTAGGRLHVLLGNHEVMNLVGDLRYVSAEEYAEFAMDEKNETRASYYQSWLKQNQQIPSDENQAQFNSLFPPGYFAHRAAYQADGVYGQWLLQQPFVIQINDQLFAHAGLSKKIKGKTLASLNQELREALAGYVKTWQSLIDTGLLPFDAPFEENLTLVEALPSSEATQKFIDLREHLLFSNQSPTWYRGNAICHPYFENDLLQQNLSQWNATRLWVGHTTTLTKNAAARLNQQLMIVDTGMLHAYYQGQPVAAKLDKGQVSIIHGKSGELLTPGLVPNRENANPPGMTDDALESFLLTANIVDKKMTKEGRTKPMRLTLSKDGKTIEALFKYQGASSTERRGSIRRSSGSPDKYENEVAAYHLDRMLGIGIVPVTVERVIDGRKGSLQFWLDGLYNVITLRHNNIDYNGYCDLAEQVNFMDTFDYLIANEDRNQSNIMYSLSDFQVWFIDHSKSFSTSTRRPKILRGATIQPSETFRAALLRLDEAQLQKLEPWLNRSQINAIWERRNKILSGDF
jgi:hypothetical protein